MNFAGQPRPQPGRRGLLGRLERGLTRLASAMETSIAMQNAQRMAAMNRQATAAAVNPPPYTPSPTALLAATPAAPQASAFPAHAEISPSTVLPDMEGIYEPDLSGPLTREMGMGLIHKAHQLQARIAQLEAEGASPGRIAYLRLELAKTLAQTNTWMQNYAAFGHAT
ncbi:hypothetical protein H2198_004486 [Neophaeococcomyces mojaviensis]|uniref:Uncharacterized protein n=1 Tax=Neophaeococcomyces mojaviensis TaxID=3383035 RepID=A0ACC3A8U1_9EURO|nr:hypothetical protein H2198_004486 [Knufia sp. JES_112]